MENLIDILLEVSTEKLQQDWVDKGKISQEYFDSICRATNNKSAYTTWLLKKVSDKIVPWSVNEYYISEWSEAFKVFEKNKQEFELKDINQYKTREQIEQFFGKVHEVKEELKRKAEERDVDRFKIGAVKLGDKVYLVYKLPKGHEENKPIAVKLGRTQTGNRGWCTSYDGNTSYWGSHIKQEDLYIFINPQDRLNDKYQIQFGYYDARPFSIVTDQPCSMDEWPTFLPFYQFLREKEGRPIPTKLKRLEEYREAYEDPTSTIESLLKGGILVVSPTMALSQWVRPLCDYLNLSESGKSEEEILNFIKYVDGVLEQRSETLGVLRRGSEVFLVGYKTATRDFEYIGYELTNPFGQIMSRRPYSLLTYLAQRGADDEYQEELYRLLEGFSREFNLKIPLDLKLKYRADSFPPLSDFHKGKIGKIDYYIFNSDDTIYKALAEALNVDNPGIVNYSNMITSDLENKGAFLVQGKDVVVLKNIESRLDKPSLIRFNKGSFTRQDNYNPDVIYEMYKNLKSLDENVVYPANIQKIAEIKENNNLEQYEIPAVGSATKLYRIPGNRVQELVPYALPSWYSTREERVTYLGYISKWQFTLSDSGELEITGRWGSSGSASWIESIPGLGETLLIMCETYEISEPDGLRSYLYKHRDIRERVRQQMSQTTQQSQEPETDQPVRPEEPEQTEEPRQQTASPRLEGEEEGIESRSIQQRLASASSRGLLQNETIHIANYITSNGRQRSLILTENCLHGTWEQFEHSLLRSRTNIVPMAIQWCQENDCEITEVYVWPCEGTWNGLLVVKNREGETVRIYRRTGSGMNASYRAYRNSNEWTLTL